ncbi:biopolymer transporter ExbD [Flavobacterium sp. GA093]|uniref:Biopolymer transporter ExbD n=1 Tax=Flavobacterium hydrocarbonoxydans TaxID=2683249 RepID=A0A6I4NQ30_9FLAO|nr:biopolymer transporter ExbD [Flavobacterium hydrocarbonoxydans]MWB96350.1 biopolymer transporter ExbD [Flavobacterium hydrocarbonoxydans]
MRNLPKKVRSRKMNSRVDLTAMVSISFLLIIFFMVVGELSKPKMMALGLPDYDAYTCGRVNCGAGTQNRTLTVLLDDNDKIVTYFGLIGISEISPKIVKYGKDGIRKELANKAKQVIEYTGDYRKSLIVIIKPSKKSNYGNLVDILDEMAITKIDTYVIVNDFSPEETKLLASK